MKGLKRFLAKITQTPRSTLINRYLALVAEMRDEGAKTERVLDLAAALLKSRPEETLRLAHMVFDADRYNLRALDLMIEGMTARGRLAKAEALRLEKHKIEAEIANKTQRMDDPSQTAVSDPSQADIFGLRHLDIAVRGEGTEADPRLAVTERLDELPRSAVLADSPGVSAASRRRLEALAAMEDHQPGDTVLPFIIDQGEEVTAPHEPLAPKTGSDRASLEAQTPIPPPPPVITGSSMPPEVPHLSLITNSGASLRGAKGESSRTQVPAAELFDHFWRQGYVREARDVLMRSSHVAAQESWWQARRALLRQETAAARHSAGEALRAEENAREGLEIGGEGHRRRRPWPPSRVSHDTHGSHASHSWSVEIAIELARLARMESSWPMRLPPAARAPIRSQQRTVPSALIQRLAAIDTDCTDAASALARKWDLISALWGGEPDGGTVQLLTALRLEHQTPAFFGLYLDGLLQDRQAAKALNETRRVLHQTPTLAWARVIWARLPRIWSMLRVQGFRWSEDEGVPSLLKRLSMRPLPTASGVAALPAARRIS